MIKIFKFLLIITSLSSVYTTALANSFNLVSKQEKIDSFPKSEYQTLYTEKLLSLLASNFDEQDYFLKDRTQACYKNVRDCDAELEALGLKLINDGVGLEEQLERLDELFFSCLKSPKALDKKCSTPIVQEIVDNWINEALSEGVNPVGNTAGTTETYLNFRERFYKHFVDDENTRDLHIIFNKAKSDLIDIVISLNHSHSL